MKSFLNTATKTIITTAILCAASVMSFAAETPKPPTPSTDSLIALEVFKSPTCGCCAAWIEHIEERGFTAKATHPKDLTALKKKLGIAQNVQSCHTGVSETGYFFEGHIPAHIIKQFLATPPKNAVGLAVPGMPMGSPGMEMGDQFRAYDVMLVNSDGSTEVYASVTNAESQYATTP